MRDSWTKTALPGNRRGQTPAKTVGSMTSSAFTRPSGKDATRVGLVSGRIHGWIFPLFLLFMGVFGWNMLFADQFLPPKKKEFYISGTKVLPLRNYRAEASPEELQAAQGIESLLIDHMIQEMRKTVPDNDIIPVSHGEKVFRQMMDSEYANTLARSGMIGIADQVLAEMKSKK